MREVTDQKLDESFDVTERALAKVKIGSERPLDWQAAANDFLRMAKSYISDARYFRKQGDMVRAFGSIYYAHAWLDAGARLGFFDVDGDSTLFTVDKEMFEDRGPDNE